MKDNDQLKLTSRIPLINWLGLLFFWGGVFLLYTALYPWITIASVLGALVIMLTGLLVLLFRRILLINRRKLTVGTHLGFIIPFREDSRIILKFNQCSIKEFDRVTFQHEETYISPEPGIDPGGFVNEYYVGLANDQAEIRLATFGSHDSAEKHAEEIETFLYSE